MIDDVTSDSPDSPPAATERGDDDVPRRDTPLLPPSVPTTTDPRATLTVLTGIDAGRILAIHVEGLTVGRAPESDLVIDEMGVSYHHARIGRTAEGSFYLEDLASTNGTFLANERVGLALLHTGDLLQLGPHVRLRFAVVDAVPPASIPSAR
jgi:pSer/pThr/pTyr-binding forkhead associated (FHA) protein